MPERAYRTRIGRVARLNASSFPWQRNDFAWLGVIDFGDYVIGWAWHEDGRSIDRDDSGFDLMDFPVPKANWAVEPSAWEQACA